jgi:NADH-quinone oxidoreductase subunit N
MSLMSDLQLIAPDALLAGFALAGILVGAFVGDATASFMRLAGSVALSLAAYLAVTQFGMPSTEAFGGLYRVASFTVFAKALTYGLAAVALLMSGRSMKLAGGDRYEYALLVVLAAAGAGIILSANDLMTLYVGIETLSLSSYILAAFKRDSVRSAEAGLKYFVLGALASGLLLYGASLIYGFAGSTRFEVIAQAPMSIGMVFGLVLLIVGLAFKAAAAPMHVWTPDVYEGAPAPVVAFFATAPKVATVVVFANVLFHAFGPGEASWRMIVAILSAASMLIGAFGALAQNNLRRILAYSSISNVGFVLIGVAAGADIGSTAILVYMTLYAAATLGLFAGVMTLRRNGQPLETVADLNGLSKQKPAIALGLLILIFSVAGIPPAAGFWGKWEVFTAGLRADMLWLVLVGAVSTVVSLGYYLRLIWAMFMKPAGEALDRSDWIEAGTVLVSAVLAFPFLTIFIQGVIDAATRATVT